MRIGFGRRLVRSLVLMLHAVTSGDVHTAGERCMCGKREKTAHVGGSTPA
jgi:hypothetical protein